MSHVVGIDLGGSSIKAVCVSAEGGLLAEANVPFVDRDREWADKVRALASDFARAHGAANAIGLSAPGLTARDGRSIAFMPGRLSGLEGLDWTAWLGATRPVPVLNDAQAALLGEIWKGAARGATNAILFTLGTGVGGAAMVDGHLLRGHLGRAGHLGHVTVDFEGAPDSVNAPGSIEGEIGNKNIRERSGGRFRTTLELVDAHRAGDAEATRLWLRSTKALAAAIASLVNVLDPEVVIVGGGIARAGEALFGPLREDLERFEWRPGGSRVRVVPAELGDLAGAYGAAWNALSGGR
ncbi:MAG: ROK family protein [Verrucomicrobia bacterium]|nr:MAG: ROK family protein [Verrucomicrobiota bacterium]